jgi:NTE family protein
MLLDGWDIRNVTFSVGARMTVMDLGHYGAELRVDALVGSEYLLTGEYYRPLTTKRPFFLAPRAVIDNAPLNYYNENGLVAEYRTRTSGGGIDVGDYFSPAQELRIGYEAAYFQIYPNVVNPASLPTHASGREGDTHVRYVYDNLDDPITPLSGLRLETNWEWWDAKPVATSAFPEGELRMLNFTPIRSASSIYLGASGGSTFWTNPPIVPPAFTLGGSFRLPSYNTNELLTNQYFLFQGGYIYKLSQLSPLLGGKVLLFAGADVGKAYGYPAGSGVSKLPSDGAAGIVINTLIGPIVIGGAIGDNGHHKFFFELGKAYF